jgi:hypothetical protein
LARAIAIKTEVHVLGKAKKLIQLFTRRRRAESRNRKVDAVPRQSDDVHVTLDDDQLLYVSQGLAGLEKSVEFPPFVKQNCLGRVQVLRLPITQRSSAKPDRSAARVPNRKHYAITEAVVMLAIVLANDQAGRKQAFCGFG